MNALATGWERLPEGELTAPADFEWVYAFGNEGGFRIGASSCPARAMADLYGPVGRQDRSAWYIRGWYEGHRAKQGIAAHFERRLQVGEWFIVPISELLQVDVRRLCARHQIMGEGTPEYAAELAFRADQARHATALT
jgi:hypothetical protein